MIDDHKTAAKRRPDLAPRQRYLTTPATMEVVSYSKRGDRWLRQWMRDDQPCRLPADGRLFIILLESQAGECLREALRTGLQLDD